MKRGLFAAVAVAAVVGLSGAAQADSTTTTPNGTWTAHPGHGPSYEVAVQQPINTDGSSNFKSNGNAVIPVKFSLKQGLGAFVFESIGSDGPDPNPLTTNDYSFLTFTPKSAMTFADLTDLTATYSFTLGDCLLGSLRWSVRVDSNNNGLIDPYEPTTNPAGDRVVFIYYGLPPNFGNGGDGGCTPSSSGGASQSTVNLLGASQQGVLRFDVLQFGGPFYGTYADAMAATTLNSVSGGMRVWRAGLVLESGYEADQRLTLTNATFGTSSFTDTFVPAAQQAPQPTCNLPGDAKILITKTGGSPSGPVNEPVSIQPADDNGVFRVVDCKLMYNLATSSLSGVGTYKVEVEIGGVPATGAAIFELR